MYSYWEEEDSERRVGQEAEISLGQPETGSPVKWVNGYSQMGGHNPPWLTVLAVGHERQRGSAEKGN